MAKTMGKHTPGPWQVGALGMIHDCSGEAPIYSRRICLVYGAGLEPNPKAEDLANAELIAQAPMMAAELGRLRAVNAALLEALQREQPSVPTVSALDWLRALLAEATANRWPDHSEDPEACWTALSASEELAYALWLVAGG